MELSNIQKLKGNKGKKKIVGRGRGSGKGCHTVGKGQKGQKSRAGKNIPWGFEGGQVPLYKRLPQLGGFKSLRRRKVVSIPMESLNVFEEGTEITPADLVKKGMIKKTRNLRVKILNGGDMTKKLTLKGFYFSESAKEKLEKAGSIIS